MKKLVVLEDERKIQPFMIAEMQMAKPFFDEIIIVTKELTSELSTTNLADGVSHMAVTRKDRIVSFILTLYLWFSAPVLNILRKANVSHRFNVGLLQHICLYLVDSDAMYRKVRRIINKDSDIVLMSCWFSCEALALAKLKEKFHGVMAISLAHSFEIDPLKNKYVDLLFNDAKHKWLDQVYFISDKMREKYNSATNEKYSHFPSSVTYLGCIKKEVGLNPYETSNPIFKICTCSNVVPVKNLQLIVDALKMWSAGNVEWTHFGAGPGFENMKKEAKTVDNTNVRIILRGNVPNSEVHKYFATNQVDLFLNVSKSEGLPVSLMEAIAYGIPILATDVGGSSEIVDTAFGVLVSSNPTPVELLSAINAFMVEYKENALNMRKAAHQFWTDKFDAEKNMPEFWNEVVSLSTNIDNI